MFSAGDIVAHHTYGTGKVISARTEPRIEVVVQFAGEVDSRTMSGEVPARALRKLPANGLESLLFVDPAVPQRLAQDAPLKLIALTLVDLTGQGKPAELRDRITRAHVLPGTWDSWWKRVQPAIKVAPYFRLGNDGAYQLHTPPDDIPEARLPSPAKPAKPRPSPDELADKVEKLERGEIQLVGLGSAEVIRAAIGLLMKKGTRPERLRAILVDAMTAPVPIVRAVLDEALKARMVPEAVDMTERLVGAIQDELRGTSIGGSLDGERILARAKVLQEYIIRLMGQTSGESEGTRVATLLSGLLVDLVSSQGGTWRTEALSGTADALVALTSRTGVIDAMAEGVQSSAREPAQQQLALSMLVARIDQVHGRDAVVRLLGTLFSLSRADLIEPVLSREFDEETRVVLLGILARRVAGAFNGIPQMARVLLGTRQVVSPDILESRLSLALAFGLLNHEAGRIVAPVIGQDLAAVLVAASAGNADYNPAVQSILSVVTAHLDKSTEEIERFRSQKEAENQAQEELLSAAVRDREELRKLAGELQSGYRGASDAQLFQGKREVLAGVASLYQEMYLAQESGTSPSTSWVLARLESILQLQGAVHFADVGSVQPFEPSRHEAVPGHRVSVDQVRVVCPGFECVSPSGDRIVLARAKVVAA